MAMHSDKRMGGRVRDDGRGENRGEEKKKREEEMVLVVKRRKEKMVLSPSLG